MITQLWPKILGTSLTLLFNVLAQKLIYSIYYELPFISRIL